MRMLGLGGEDVNAANPMHSMVSTALAVLARKELEIKRERIIDSAAKGGIADKDLDGRPQAFTASRLRTASWFLDGGNRPP